MTPKCVCSHDSFIHFACAGVCFERTCGCESYMPDNGMEMPSVHPRSEVYDGFYSGKKWPPPSQETA